MTNGQLVAIHQPNFLPWLGFFDKMRRVDRFVLLDCVALPHTGGHYTNRVKILVNGRPTWISVPVVRGADARSRIDHARIAEHGNWRRKLRMTIMQSYARTRGFDYVFPLLDPLFAMGDHLAAFNTAGILALAKVLGINTEKIVAASTLGVEGRSTDLLVAIVKAVGGSVYLVGGGADGYQRDEAFEAEGIAVQRQNFRHPVYPQPTPDFVPGLSAVDALMHCGPEGARRLLEPNGDG